MPDITQANLVHWCVVWRRTDTLTRMGQARVERPVNIRCRWNINDQMSVSQDSSPEQYPRQVPVGEYVPLGSYVWGPGRIADLPAKPQYLEVISSEHTTDLKGRHPYNSVSLQKASKGLPEIRS